MCVNVSLSVSLSSSISQHVCFYHLPHFIFPSVSFFKSPSISLLFIFSWMKGCIHTSHFSTFLILNFLIKLSLHLSSRSLFLVSFSIFHHSLSLPPSRSINSLCLFTYVACNKQIGKEELTCVRPIYASSLSRLCHRHTLLEPNSGTPTRMK